MQGIENFDIVVNLCHVPHDFSKPEPGRVRVIGLDLFHTLTYGILPDIANVGANVSVKPDDHLRLLSAVWALSHPVAPDALNFHATRARFKDAFTIGPPPESPLDPPTTYNRRDTIESARAERNRMIDIMEIIVAEKPELQPFAEFSKQEIMYYFAMLCEQCEELNWDAKLCSQCRNVAYWYVFFFFFWVEIHLTRKHMWEKEERNVNFMSCIWSLETFPYLGL